MALNVRLFRFHKKALSRFYSYPVLKGGKLSGTHKMYTPSIDIDSDLENLCRITESIEIRKSKFDILQLKSSWELVKNMEELRDRIKTKVKELNENMKILQKKEKNEDVTEQIRKTKHQMKIVKEDFASLLIAVQNAREKAHSYGLMMPNEIHKETPRDEDKLVYEFGKLNKIPNVLSHLNIGENLNVIHYKNPSCFFLMKEAAEFEISSCSFFADILRKNGFTCFSNPDFVKRVIVEGCGINPSLDNKLLTLKDKIEKDNVYTVHLVGGSSIYPFCAFHANQTIHFSCLPLKYFTIGRQYGRGSSESKLGLYDTWQRTANDIFILTRNDPEEMMLEFEKALALVISIYEKFNYHFRVVYIKASDLEIWEILRASFQIYSSHYREYIEIGNISISDSYISRRLLISYEDEKRSSEYMKMISGTLVNITKFLAYILEQENSGKKFCMPQCLECYRSK